MTKRSIPGGEYSIALQNPICFHDPDLKDGDVETNAMGLPLVHSGNFASVFKIITRNERVVAVKCFTHLEDDAHDRYTAIHAALHPLTADWKIEFEYLEDEILVDSVRAPVLKMDWVSGENLTDFINSNLANPVHLKDITTGFRRVVLDLESHGLAHGDLQHGNILVRPNGHLTLIDYDGMYVPALNDRTSHEAGHPNYQHPKRGAAWGLGIDRFSAWVIHATLEALATEPGLWDVLHSDPDKLLLDAADFQNWRGCRPPTPTYSVRPTSRSADSPRPSTRCWHATTPCGCRH